MRQIAFAQLSAEWSGLTVSHGITIDLHDPLSRTPIKA
jgi:hypothetical protein